MEKFSNSFIFIDIFDFANRRLAYTLLCNFFRVLFRMLPNFWYIRQFSKCIFQQVVRDYTSLYMGDKSFICQQDFSTYASSQDDRFYFSLDFSLRSDFVSCPYRFALIHHGKTRRQTSLPAREDGGRKKQKVAPENAHLIFCRAFS